MNRIIMTVAAACVATVMGTFDASAASGKRIAALDDAHWSSSVWISAANAPVVTGRIEGKNERAADGASWFLTTVKNEKRVAKARWMTAGLGVYQLYVNGKSIGTEVLRPGFTHYEKTKLSFAYDVTDAFTTAAGAENVLSVQVTPGWWGDKIVTPGGNEGMIGKKVAFRGVLELTYADVANPAFKHIIMKPIPDKRLGFVKAEYNSAAGLIKSEWHYEGDKWIWKFTIPQGATATVTLPGESEAKEYKAGTHQVEKVL